MSSDDAGVAMRGGKRGVEDNGLRDAAYNNRNNRTIIGHSMEGFPLLP